MPKFIKTNTIVEVNRHGIESDRQVLFTEDEVVARVLLNPSLVIEVTESHAAQVVRVQGKYQEVSEDTLGLLAIKRAEGEGLYDKIPAEIEGLDDPSAHGDDIDVVSTDDGEAPAPADDDEAPAPADDDEAPLTFGGGTTKAKGKGK